MQQYKQIFFILTLLVIIPQLVAASSQSLTYNNANNQVNISYDSLNRLLTKNSSADTAIYAYDSNYYGTLTNITFGNSTYKYEYDDKLRVTRETRTIDGIVFEKKNYYDSMDRFVKQTFFQGKNISYYYNEQGKISKILGYINSTFHNAFDSILNRTYANSKIANFTYNSDNARLTQIKTNTIQQLDYSYDSVGNVITINDSVNSRNHRMSYDFLGRLVNVSIGTSNYVYSYNPIGNILKIVRDRTNTTKFVYTGTPVHTPSQIITGNAGIDVYKLSQLDSTGKSRQFQFYLVNEKNTTLTNVNWTVAFGDGTLLNSTSPINITNSSISFIAQHNYTSGGFYNVNVTGRSAASSDFENRSIKFGVMIPSFSIIYKNVTYTVSEFFIHNNMTESSQNVSWNCSDGTTSILLFSLSGNEYLRVLTTYNYSSTGARTLTCSANSTDGNDTKSTNFEIKGIKIEGYNNIPINGNNRTIQFKIKNYYYPASISWSIVSDGQIQHSGTTNTIATGSSETISRDINYTTDGIKTIIVNISSGSLYDQYNDSFNLKAIRIENYYNYNLTAANRILIFNIKNYWPQNMNVSWNVSDPTISSNNIANLTQGESVFVFIQNNYTTQGRKTPKITAYSNSSLDSYTDIFITKMIEINKFLILSESQSNTIFEIIMGNNLGQQNISWRLDTGEKNITSSQPIFLNTSEKVRIFIGENYTTADIYPVTAFVNSSSYNDTASGVVVI